MSDLASIALFVVVLAAAWFVLPAIIDDRGIDEDDDEHA